MAQISQCKLKIEKGGYSERRLFWTLNQSKIALNQQSDRPVCLKIFSTLGYNLKTWNYFVYNETEYLLLVCSAQSYSILLVISGNTGNIVRSIEISSVVTCVSHIKQAGVFHLFDKQILSEFSGAVACGLDDGRVIIIDLALDQSFFGCSFHLHLRNRINVVPYTTDNINLKISEAVAEGKHLSLALNFQYLTNNNSFKYCEVGTNKLVGSFEKATVTALHHIHLAGALLVGYSFGGFQIYSLTDASLMYSSRVNIDRLEPPVTHFAVQEPENDPRPFLYFWTCRNGPEPQGVFSSTPSATLYQLAFNKKLRYSTSMYYQQLQGCSSRFTFLLWPSFNSSAVMMKCYTIERVSSSTVDHDTSDSTVIDSTLVVFMCRGVNDEANKGTVAIFDINGWYRSQMPFHPQCKKKLGWKSCSYLSMHEISVSEGQLLDGMVHSFSCFESPMAYIDSHSSPESLSFNVELLSTAGCFKYIIRGIQCYVINEMLTSQANIMVTPEKFVSMCSDANLYTPTFQDSHAIGTSSEEMQHYLLLVCLCYELRSTLLSIAEAVVGPVGYPIKPQILHNWIHSYIKKLGDQKNAITEELFDSSGGNANEATLMQINHIHHQLDLIKMMTKPLLSESSELFSYEHFSPTYHLADMHSQVLQTTRWCIDMKFLPQLMDIPLEEGVFMFPIEELANRYSILEKHREDCGLAIDCLLNEIPVVEGTVLKYPPANIFFLLQVAAYPDSIARQALILYTLLDIATPPGDPQFAKQYVVEFGIENEMFNLSHNIWSIDHASLPNIDCIQEIRINFPNIYTLAVHRLIDLNCISQAIQCVYNIDGFTSLKIRMYLSDENIHEAFNCVECCTDDYHKYLEEFVGYCLESPVCIKMLDIQMSEQQLSEVCDILCQIGGERAIQLALRLLLVHRCTIKAIALAKEREKEGGVFATSLIKMSNKLPNSQRSICSMDLFKKVEEIYGKQDHTDPQPLSSVITKSSSNFYTSQTDLILAVTERIAEIKQKASEPITPFKDYTDKPASRVSSIPFVSSPSLSHSSIHSKSTPAMTPVAQRAFVQHMEDFKTRISLLSTIDNGKRDVIKTPMVQSTVAPPTSILKSSRTEQITSTNDKKIRFALEESLNDATDSGSESYYSLEDSLNFDDGINSSVKKDDVPVSLKGSIRIPQLSSVVQKSLSQSPVMSMTESAQKGKQPLVMLGSKKISQPRTKTTKSKTSTIFVSNVMVPDQPEYTFSPPSTVVAQKETPPPTQPLRKDDTGDTFVFSPPLLRSASRQKKEKQFSKFSSVELLERTTRRSTPTTRHSSTKTKLLYND